MKAASFFTHPLTGKRYPAGFFDPGTVDDLLLLVDVQAPTYLIKKWTPEQLAEAGNWAMRTHVRASDNPYVRVPSKPDFLKIAEGAPVRGDEGTVFDLAPRHPEGKR